jgi:filamentous hemagglutinin
MPRDLKEQAALLVTRADPSNGEVLPIALNDKRWPSSGGWQKMQAVHRTSDGRNITIHYVMNKNSGQVDDFKFKD